MALASGAATSKSRRVPVYQTLLEELRRALLRGDFADGSALPTESALAEQHRVSRQTVRRAFQDLVAEGLVYRVPGKGTFANPGEKKYLRQFGSVEELMGLSLDTRLRVLMPPSQRIEVDAASRLRLDTDVVTKMTFLREHDGSPFCLTDVYLPTHLAELLPAEVAEWHAGDLSSITIVGALDRALPEPIREADQSISATAASAEVAQQLGISEGAALLRIDRLYFDAAGTPCELAKSYFLPSQYSYRVRLRRDQH